MKPYLIFYTTGPKAGAPISEDTIIVYSDSYENALIKLKTAKEDESTEVHYAENKTLE